MDDARSLEQQEADIGHKIEQVSLSNNGSRSPPSSGAPGPFPAARGAGSTAAIPRPFATSILSGIQTAAGGSSVDSGAAQLVTPGGGEDVEMSSSAVSAIPTPASTTDTETGATGQQPPTGATPAGIPPPGGDSGGVPGMPPGMAAPDPFAMLVMMSDRLIEESYSQAASKDSEPGVANKRPHSGAEAGGAGEPHIKVQKREGLGAGSSGKDRR